MLARTLGCLLLFAMATPGSAAPGNGLGCAAFIKGFPAGLSGFKASFERPLTINRGFGETLEGIDVHILATNADLDGTLKCRGDAFLRFELRLKAPAKDKQLGDFAAFEQAALITAFGWDRAKAQTVARAMDADAAEYLRASEQRGDLYVAGKVEYHQGDALDLGVIWTPSDHTFVIAAQTSDD